MPDERLRRVVAIEAAKLMYEGKEKEYFTAKRKVARRYGHPSDLTILYLPQLIGMALGLSDDVLGLQLNLALSDHFRNKCKSAVNA